MARSGKWICLWAWLVCACGDDFQRQLYDYQIERLLSGGETAVWSPVSKRFEGDELLVNCADSVRFMIDLDADSILFRRMVPRCDATGLFDTVEVAKGSASVDSQIFTDSILFTTGEFWLINTLFSTTLELEYADTTFRFNRISP